ncbi:hypothetical protein RF161_03145 [Pasteurella multocida]|uniref:hypothetical protein n=1 Tax=Pasteurella multocida TaxID=747 RepID=UPI00292E31DB|nr:hypothetical protein [Pasteurella multocida]
MQTLLIIRGHSGSGKSTFALQKMAEFKQNFTEGVLFHVENDHFLRENGEYHWTVERFQQAKQLAQQQLADALSYCVENPQHDVCIILSNVGGNAKEIEKVIARATSYGLHTEVYRLQNFFPNTHGVDAQVVYEMYLHLCDQPVQNEILLPPIQPMTKAMCREIKKLQAQKRKNRYTKKM